MEAILLIGMPGAGEYAIIAIMLLLPAIALFDILQNQFKDQIIKLIWVLVVIFLPLFGPIIYYAIGRTQKLA
jgi:multisubunit Na+/H+ antiporter MnhG subunit